MVYFGGWFCLLVWLGVILFEGSEVASGSVARLGDWLISIIDVGLKMDTANVRKLIRIKI